MSYATPSTPPCFRGNTLAMPCVLGSIKLHDHKACVLCVVACGCSAYALRKGFVLQALGMVFADAPHFAVEGRSVLPLVIYQFCQINFNNVVLCTIYNPERAL